MIEEKKHFQGKTALEHVIDARLKGKVASQETHRLEISTYLEAFIISIKETSTLFLFLWATQTLLMLSFQQILLLNSIFFFGFLIYKISSFAQYGWLRLERLNRLIQEEKWEIEHHPSQEKEELKAMYELKGFSGKLLDEVVDVLMADDNRLLQVMLEEEMGLVLSSIEHPLKQSFYSFLGVILSVFSIGLSIFLLPTIGIYISVFFLLLLANILLAKQQKTDFLSAFIWNICICLLSLSMIFFLGKIILKFLL